MGATDTCLGPFGIPGGVTHSPSFTLPPELVEAIKDDDYACVTLAADQGTTLTAKMPAREIEDLRGTYPIQLRHEGGSDAFPLP